MIFSRDIIKKIQTEIKRLSDKYLHLVMISSVVVLAIVPIMLLSGCQSKDKHLIDAIRIVTDIESQAATQEITYNASEALNIPTQITKYGESYFIMDCYNDQVIWNDDLNTPIADWKVMSIGINRGHTVASDGTIYLVDNTDSNQILVYERTGDKFVLTQYLDGIGFRPHYIVYDDSTDTFYAWSSFTGEMYLVKRSHKEGDNNLVYVSDIKKIESLNEVYIRSFTMLDNSILFVSGSNGKIIEVDKKSFKIINEYPVPDEIAGMVQIMPVENQYLITVSTDIDSNQDYATIIQTKSLEGLIDGDYTDVYANFEGGGTPYYISEIEGKYYLTEHRNGHALWKFGFENGEIINPECVY